MSQNHTGSVAYAGLDNHTHGEEEDVLEPIAVVGMSLKFPGDADNEESFWEMMMEKHCATTEFPQDRLNSNAFYNSESSRLSTISMKGGHFLTENPQAFDAPFFSMSPAEASAMDPQQLGLLEATYHALENAGIPIENIKGSNTSVHVGSFTDDYKMGSWRDAQQIPKYSILGVAAAVLSGRISCFFDLRGPSVTINTACSSSLVALAMSCNSLWAGESDIGIAAGSSIIHSAELSVAFSNMNFLSPDSRCHSFDQRANGYGRGEGFGVLILKRLSSAVQDGDFIRALIRSTGINQDGGTSGITEPSCKAQSDLITKTYQRAALDQKLTGFFEAHGTGTPIGDPIEARAIGESFRCRRSQEQPLYIGAVKSNIGHLEGSAGIAGAIKAIMVLEKGIIPANANFENLNRRIDAEFFNLKFPTEAFHWPNGSLRRASVNSFGIGGTNAHVVIDDADYYFEKGKGANVRVTSKNPSRPKYDQTTIKTQENNGAAVSLKPKLFILSAADQNGTHRLAISYTRHFIKMIKAGEVLSPAILDDLAFTFNARRSLLTWRSYIVVGSDAALMNLDTAISTPVKPRSKRPTLGFAFTGQGAQWAGMGKELRCFPVFESSILCSQQYLLDMGCEWTLIDEIERPQNHTRIHEPEYSQPISTALQIALVDLLKSLNLVPSMVVGHSSGEIAAAYCIGSITAQAAIKISYHRGVLASKLRSLSSEQHCMASIGTSRDDLHNHLTKASQLLEFSQSSISLSCINSNNNVTISGPEVQVKIFISYCEEENIFARKLKVQVGYHSPQMEQISSAYFDRIESVEAGPRRATGSPVMISSVSADIVSWDLLCTAGYWVSNMVSPVNFLGALQRCCKSYRAEPTLKLDGSHSTKIAADFWLEIGPHSSLQGPIRDILALSDTPDRVGYSSTLVHSRSGIETLLEAGGRLYCHGFSVQLDRLNQLNSTKQHPVAGLPEYPFDHSIVYEQESRLNKQFRLRSHGNNDLLGTRVLDWNYLEPTWRLVIRLDEMTWLEDHKVNDTTIYPAAGMLAMVIEAAKELSEDFEQNITGYEIRDAVFHTPLVFPEATRVRETQISLRPISTAQIGENEWYDYRLYASKTDGEWEEICRGSVCVATEQLEVDFDDEFRKQLHQLEGNISASMASCQNQIAPELLYKGLKAIGLDLGPSLQLLDQIRFNNTGKAVATVKKSILSNATTAESKQTPVQDCVIHPTSLDSILQLVFVAWTRGGLDAAHVMIPTRIDKMKISGITNAISCSGPFTVCAQSNDVQEHHSLCTVSALSQDNHSVIIQGAEFTTISDRQTTLQKKNENFHLCYSMDWNVDLDTMSGTEILEHCSKAVTTDGKPIKWYQDIELMALTFGANVLDTLKHSNQVVLPSMRKYVAWIQELVDRQLAPLDPNDRDARRLEAVDFGQSTCIPSKMEDNIIEEVFINVGKSLQDILVGDLDPLRIIYGDEDRIRGFYQQINEESHVFDAFSVYLGALLHKTSGMNILEIGGGTAATTELLHKTLSPMSDPRYSKYHFTDISPSLLDKAKIVLQRYERVKFDILDIEKDPMTQGFQKESYDLIVASQVFHATKNLEETIRHARSLLKPGGKLILVELTTQRALPGFVFGLLPGWWRGIEPYRQKSPCISESMWNELLTINGFSGSDVVFRDYENDECHIWSLIVATAMSPAWSQLHDLVLIIDKKSYPQQELAREVGRKLQLMKVPRIETMDLEEASKLDFERDVHVAFLSDLLSPILQGIKSQPFQRLKTILLSARTFLWVTKGGEQSDHAPAHGMVQGLCRVIRQESPHVALSVLSIERAVTTDKIRQANAIAKVLQRSASTFGTEQFEPEYFEVDGLLHINRLTEARVANEYIKSTSTPQARLQKFGQGPSLKLEPKNLGLISSLHFVQDEVNTPLGPTEIEVHVQAVGVNFRDCLATLGRLKDSTLGFECAGTVSRVGEKCQIMVPGDRVVLCATGCYKTMVRGESQCAIIIPPTMSFSEAASFPICFGTAYYCLVNIANIQPGESVLIHSASGGTGQAALQIALLLRAEVFVTVGSDTKKRLLMDTYNLPEDRIFYSRNTSFASGVKRMTGNRGVDVVINSLSGRRLLASWECVAPFGHFLELGKADIDAHNSLPLHPFGNNASFTGVDFTTIFQQRPTTVQTILSEIFTLALTKRIRPPHPLQLSSIQEVEKVFRTLQSGNSSGKFVLETMKSAMVPTSLKRNSDYSFKPDATYLISGGLGGIGRAIVKWLVQRGARNLLLLSRSGLDGHPKAKEMVSNLSKTGVRIEAPICDISDRESLQSVLKKYTGIIPAVKSCFQAAMVLKDSPFMDMSFKEWHDAVRPKVDGSWNLHKALPRGLDFFVLLSSICGIYGNPGQSNYSAANTYQDTLARHRVAHGQHAISLDLGPMLFEGYVAENPQIVEHIRSLKVQRIISQEEFNGLLDFSCDPDMRHTRVSESQIVTGVELPARILAGGSQVPPMLCQPLFRNLHQVESHAESVPLLPRNAGDYQTRLLTAGSLGRAGSIISEALRNKLSQILALSEDSIDLDITIDRYGIDSLVTVELRNWLAKDIGVDVAVFDIRGATINEIGLAAANKRSPFRNAAAP